MPRRILRDRQGGPLLEFTVLLVFFFVFVFGMIEFMLLFWQFNGASKAVQHGARIAAVSDPVAEGFWQMDGLVGGRQPGDPMPGYTVVCDGSGTACSCTGEACSGSSMPLSTAALRTIVFGRGATSNTCQAGGLHQIGMCFFFPQIGLENVRITYTQTGLGFVTRPGGPVPTITIEFQGDLAFRFFFLGGLIDLNEIAFPILRTTVTGEDLSRSWPPPTA